MTIRETARRMCADMNEAGGENQKKQIVVGAAILLLLAFLAAGVVIGAHSIPGVVGEWISMMVGLMTTPVFLEISAFLVGLMVVLAINHWRQIRNGDELVYLEEADGIADLPEHVKPASLPMTVEKVQAPEKELRFTRSGQAVVFWLLAAFFAAVALTLCASSLYRDVNPALPHPAWGLLPLWLAVVLGRLAVGLTRHAYLILTPLGIEIFPFFRPARGMRLLTWQEVADAEADPSCTVLTLHHNPEKTSGIRLSLKPIRADLRALLVKAVTGRVLGKTDA